MVVLVLRLTLELIGDDGVVGVEMGGGGGCYKVGGGDGGGRVPAAAAQGVLHVVEDRVGAVDHEIVVAVLLAQIAREGVRVVASIT